MKRLCLVLTAGMLFWSDNARAQVVDIGIKLGAAASSFGGAEADPGARLRGGPAGGASMTYHMKPGLGLRLELLYLRKGGRLVNPANDSAASLQVTYIQVPVIAEWSPVRDTLGIRPYLLGGLAGAFVGLCWINPEPPSNLRRGQRCEGGISQGDWSALAGAGLSWPLGSVRGTLEARYDLGIRDIDASDAAGYVARNRSVVVLAGISIPLDRSAWGIW